MTLDELASLATVVGVAIGGCSLVYIAYQVYCNAKITRTQFWLDLERLFSRYDDVHIKLRPKGEWARGAKGPSSAPDWVKVEQYMGLFEKCKIMLDDGMLDWKTFRKLLGYRIENIMKNKIIIQETLEKERESWEDFIELVREMGHEF